MVIRAISCGFQSKIEGSLLGRLFLDIGARVCDRFQFTQIAVDFGFWRIVSCGGVGKMVGVKQPVFCFWSGSCFEDEVAGLGYLGSFLSNFAVR